MPHYNEEAFQKYKIWLETPEDQRKPSTAAQFARDNNTTPQTLARWEQEINRGDNHKEIDELPVDEQIKIFDKLLYKLAIDPKSPAKVKELFAKRYGLLIDKTELSRKTEFNADDIATANFEAERRLKEFRDRNRVEGVQERPALLPDKIREDS
jgi:hypothetical protein